MIEAQGDKRNLPVRRIEKILNELAPEVVDHFSGCGSPIPECIVGKRVIDMGCGTGRDVFLCAALAGPAGFVMGLDTELEALEIARRNIEKTMERLGHEEPNVAFRKGSIEMLRDAGVYDEDFDVVISNRAFNMVADKMRALREIYRVLKPGGEFHFSDIFSDRRHRPEDSGFTPGATMYEGDFLRLAAKAGFIEPRVLARRRVRLGDPDHAVHHAVTFRLFKIPEMEAPEEDYGQAATYLGTVDGCVHRFALDEGNLFETGRAALVGGNTALIILQSRFAPHFSMREDRKRHFGRFRSAIGPHPRETES